MYNKIINPSTGRIVSIYSKLGINIIANYLKFVKNKMNGGNGDIKILIVCSAENRKPEVDDIDSLPELIDDTGNILDPYTEKSNLDNEFIKQNIFNFVSKLYETQIENIKYATVDPTYYSEDKVKESDNSNYLGHYQSLLNEVTDTDFDCIIILNCYADILDEIAIFDYLLKDDGKILIYDYSEGIYSKLEQQLSKIETYKSEVMSNYMILSRLN